MRTPAKELLVEGSDDKYSVIHIVQHFVESDVTVTDAKGIDQVFPMIPVVWQQRDLQILGVIVDADEDCADRYKTVCEAFAQTGVALPPTLPTDGLIHEIDEEAGPRRLGVWIMPDNVSSGGLENFLLKLLPDSKLRAHAVDSAEQAINEFDAPVRPTHHEKAHLRTWLAWQEPPGLTPGLAIKKGDLNPAADAASSFVRWFMSLYELSPKASS